jgi:murein endopeptidase
MVNGLERVARRWVTERPAGASPRVGIMDVSLKNGGDISGHASHEKGVDADIVLPRNDGQDSPRVDRFSSRYSRTGTQKLVNLCRAEMTVTHVFFNDPNVSGVSKWPNHDNHLHVRIK